MSTNELQPDVDQVLQLEPAGTEPVVKVSQQGPVRTQALPRKAGATRNVTVPAMPNPFHLLRPNPRRASCLLIAEDAIYVALSTAAAADVSTMAKWPAGVPLPITATVDVWVAAQTATTVVSIVAEHWAAGEGDE